MTIFCINVGDVGYAQYSLSLIKKLCEYNNINLYILDQNISQNIYNVHPSWLKLFCHSLIDDDFILCWDLDLVPTRLYNLYDFIDTNKINLSYDQSYVREGFTFNGKFKYNCGLIGIPKIYQRDIENIYIKAKSSNYPSYEQYHVNDWIFDNKINIHDIDTKLNMMYDGTPIYKNDINYNIHYTWKIASAGDRYNLVLKHHETFNTALIN
jgi:hypothetical protein